MLSIVIPSVHYNPLLDVAIESSLSIPNSEVLVSVNGCLDDYSCSKYRNNSVVRWVEHPGPTVPPFTSFNFAIDNSKGDWIYVLSDDDYIDSSLIPEDLDLDSLDQFDLIHVYKTTVDDNQITLNQEEQYTGNYIDKNALLNQYFNDTMQHHLGKFIFSKIMWGSVDKFVDTGYVNGYYCDTVFNAKLIANSHKIINVQSYGFYKRAHSLQCSAQFYLSPSEVNRNFEIIVNSLVKNSKLNNHIIKRYGDTFSYKKQLIMDRYRIEVGKSMNNIYNTNLLLTFKIMLYSFAWDMGITNKLILLTKSPIVFAKVAVRYIRNLGKK